MCHGCAGVDQYHHFDVNDYFGSSVTLMKSQPHVVTVAVGAPGESPIQSQRLNQLSECLSPRETLHSPVAPSSPDGRLTPLPLRYVLIPLTGALENSGVIYFLNINSDGGVESYTYLSSADDSLGDYWGPNVALGWTVENIGDIDGTTRDTTPLDVKAAQRQRN